jgi:solute carrier family 25 uncoupling protein 8/9
LRSRFGFGDHLGTHTLSATAAGFVATCVGAPLDVVKTRYMNSGTSGSGAYTSVFACARDASREQVRSGRQQHACWRRAAPPDDGAAQGVMAFYKGFWPCCARITLFNVVLFVAYEQTCLLARSLSSGGDVLGLVE